MGRITQKSARQRCIEVLQAPASHYCIESKDNGRGEDAQISHPSPGLATHNTIGSGSIRLGMTAHNKLTDHARNAQQQHTGEIDEDEGSTPVMTRHERETPDIAQAHCRACRSQYDGKSAAKSSTFLHLQ